MRLNSLALRLFLSATTWTVVILLVTGIVLSSIYRAAVERAFDRRLGVYLRSLVADVATPEENAGKFPQSIGEPLFDRPAPYGTQSCRISRIWKLRRHPVVSVPAMPTDLKASGSAWSSEPSISARKDATSSPWPATRRKSMTRLVVLTVP
jgi:hypothetical protein